MNTSSSITLESANQAPRARVKAADFGADTRDPMWWAFREQRDNAKRRAIPFLFTFDEWRAWWLTDDRWSRRGRKRGCLMMARLGDAGPYSPANVHCATHKDNAGDVPPDVQAEAQRKTSAFRAAHPECRGPGAPCGARHGNARAVQTPKRVFETATAAARFYEISPRYAQQLAREGREGWCYI
jgi:hypothetical protein